MGNIKKEEQQAKKKVPAAGNAGQQNRCRGGGCGRSRNHWHNTTGGGGGQNTSARFPTRSKDLPNNAVFNNTGQVDAINFQCSLKAIVNYLHMT
jgi:hypothetical protein